MPLSAGDGPFRVVASRDFSEFGKCVSRPVEVEWRWYYHLVTLPLWAIVAVTLVGFKANRNRQAWLILIPLALVVILWRTPMLLFGANEITSEFVGCVIVTGAMAWTIVWLLGNRLASRFITLTLFLMLAIMLAFGCASFYSRGEFDGSSAYCLMVYGYIVFCLTLAMMFAARFSRRRFTPKRFGCWLFLLNAVATMTIPLCVFAVFIMRQAAASSEPFPGFFISQFIAIFTMTACLSVIVYVVNLPFLILVLKNPFYRDRFDAMFHIPAKRIQEAPTNEISH